jgi:formate hydrogenlyase subunit 6/NADH:ubiquinone oxidoreductase subunit I
MRSLLLYLRHILTKSSIINFFTIRTAPLETPGYVRDIPHMTGRRCTQCYLCMSVCPSPGAIEVLREGMPASWNPRIYPGHCIRCGMCVEICPEATLDCGRVFVMNCRSDSFMTAANHIQVNTVTCMGCGTCAVACPVNKKIDSHLAGKGTSSSDEVIIRIEKGLCRVLHEDKCTGCKTCEEQCPNKAIRVARELQACQMTYDDDV